MKGQSFFLSLSFSIILLLAWTGPPTNRQPIPSASHPKDSAVDAGEILPLSAQPPMLHAWVDPILLKQALDEENAHLRFVVEMVDQSDLWHQTIGLTKTEQRTALVETLQTTAEASQVDIRAELDSGVAQGQVDQYRSFWIFNGLAVAADADTLFALASRPDVRAIRQDRWRRWLEEPQTSEKLPQVDGTGVEWNVSRIRADLAWNGLRLDGSGVTVAIIDTGVDWQHPALKTQYRGYKPEGLTLHQGNWFCTTDEGVLYPVDGSGHGTHVAGTVVGSDKGVGQAIGIAPGARWIAVKTFSDQGYAYDSWIHAAFEWIMAPAGDPGLAPDVVNGSWGSWNDEDVTFRPDLQALRASGIVPVFAAGNEGPLASSLRSPASYPEAIAVGASDELDQVTSFSSRGPSPWGEDKPEIVAPGVQIRSSLPGGTYGVKAGTSMAAPHVAGVVALMIQADPTLSVDDVEAILTSTALPLEDQLHNNNSGWGRLDAYRAASVALKAGTISGQVRRLPDLQPLPTAQISVEDDLGEPWAIVQADQAGRYWVALPAGRYSLSAHAFGYAAQIISGVTVQESQTTNLDLTLSPSPSGVLWGQVTSTESGGPVGAEIAIVNTPARTTSDPQTGQFSIALPAGTYSLEASQNGYRRSTTSDIEIVADHDTRLDVALSPAPTLLLVDSGPWYYGSQASYFRQAMDNRDYVYDLWEIRDRGTDLPGLDDLTPYQITIWSSPLDAPGLIGAGDIISSYLTTGGNLLLSGQDVGFWDDGLNGLYQHPYYSKLLNAQAVTDNIGRADVVGQPDEIFGGLSLPMNGPDGARNQVSPDSIVLQDIGEGAIIAQYKDAGKAALRASGCQSYRAVYLAAGLEGLGDLASRAEVIERSLEWLGMPHPATNASLAPLRQDQTWLQTPSITYTVELRNTGGLTDRFALELSPSAWPATIWDASFSEVLTESHALTPCQTQTLGVEVTPPPDVAWNITDVVTLTARSQSDPDRTAQASFSSKTPAPILLVDDSRWYNTQDHYTTALDAYGVPYDLWEINTTQQPRLNSPSLQRLQRYPIVIWFTAYDWHETLTPTDENRLATYLENGGRLLFSSQDYLYTNGLTDFAQNYLGAASFTEDFTTTHAAGALGNPLGDGLGPFDLIYPFRNWSDALRSTTEARIAFWGQHAQPAALTLEESPWKTAFFAFPLESLQEQDMATVVSRAVGWLSPLGDSSLAVDHPVAMPGNELAYTLLLQNTGPELLAQVSLSNTVPPSTTYIANSLQGPAQYDSLTNRFTWNGPLASGQAITVSYRLQLDSTLHQGTVITNRAHLAEESGLSVDRLATTRIDVPDLSASVKTVSAQTATPRQFLTYTLTLRNDGLQPAQAHLIDPIPLYTMYRPGSGSASSGQLTSTADALQWTGTISTGHEVSITFPVVISSTANGLYTLNRATLTDSWDSTQTLEAYTWVEMRIFLPLVLKQH